MGKSLSKAGLVCLLSLLFVLRGNAINVDWYCDPHNGTYTIFDLESFKLNWLTDGCPMDVLLARNPYHIVVPQNIAASQSMYAVFKTHCVGFNAKNEFEIIATARNAQNQSLASQSIKCKTKAWTADRILNIPTNTENINFTYKQNGNTKAKEVKFWVPMPVHLDVSDQNFGTLFNVNETVELHIPLNTFFLENGTNSITITKNNGLNDGDFTIVRGTVNSANRCGINRNVSLAQRRYFTDTRLEANMFVVRFTPTAGGNRSCQFTISNGSQSKTITVSANAVGRSLNANFTTDGDGAVNLYVNDDPDAITTSPYVFEEGDSLTFVAVANTGSHFVNWNDDETLTDATYIVKGNEDVTVKATFAINTHNATFTTVGDGAVKLYVNDDPDAITTSPYIFEEGDSLTFVAVANTGSHFVNWNDDETLTDETYIVKSTEDVAVKANFAINTYNASFTTVGDGAVKLYVNDDPDAITTSPYVFEEGDSLTFVAVANTGSHFVNWNDDETLTDDTYIVKSNEDVAVKANFAINTYNASFATVGDGAVMLYVNDDPDAITTSPYVFEEGDSLTFVAVANTGSHFVNWNDDETLTDVTYIVESTEDVTVKANFAINTYNASFATVGDGAVMLYVNDDPDAITTSPYVFEEGDSLTFVAVANTGSHFVNWNDDVTLTDETYIVKSTEDVSVKANFAINTYNARFTTVGDGAVNLYVNDDPDAITTSPYVFEEGDSLTFVAVANTGSYFVNWNDDITLTDETHIVKSSEDVAVKANFALNYYNVSAVSSDTALGTVQYGTTPAGNYYHGEEVTFTATPKDGKVFKGWSTCSDSATIISTDLSYSVTLAGDVCLYGNFEEKGEEVENIFRIICEKQNGGIDVVFVNPLGLQDVAFVYSYDKETWTDLELIFGTLHLANKGDVVYIKAKTTNTRYRGSNIEQYTTQKTRGLSPAISVSDSASVAGNIMYLLNNEGKGNTVGQYGLTGLFVGNKIIDAKDLILPADTLLRNAYQSMFYGCATLKSAPELPAKVFRDTCYQCMFAYCTSLVAGPTVLPADTVGNKTYQGMFAGCSSLETAPAILATKFRDMQACSNMFLNCTKLETAAAMNNATMLDQYCCESMYEGCTSLVDAPALPATTLAKYCYQKMFKGCTSLETAPFLPATTLVSNCYTQMFDGCSDLNYIKVAFTTAWNTSYTSNWTRGVAEEGTFVCPVGLANTRNTSSVFHYIPTLWDIINTAQQNAPRHAEKAVEYIAMGEGMNIIVSGAEDAMVYVYDVAGHLVSSIANASDFETIPVAIPGVYVVVVPGQEPTRVFVK